MDERYPRSHIQFYGFFLFLAALNSWHPLKLGNFIQNLLLLLRFLAYGRVGLEPSDDDAFARLSCCQFQNRKPLNGLMCAIEFESTSHLISTRVKYSVSCWFATFHFFLQVSISPEGCAKRRCSTEIADGSSPHPMFKLMKLPEFSTGKG